MDPRRARIEMIRERHRKLILEPRGRIEYALVDDWDDEPLPADGELAGVCAQLSDDSDEDE